MYGYGRPLKPSHANILKTYRLTLLCLTLTLPLVFAGSCATSEPGPALEAGDTLEQWLHEEAQLAGHTPKGWARSELSADHWTFSHPDAPQHVLNIQRLTLDIGRGPLKIMRETFKEHPYFTDFAYESSWEMRIDSVWAPAFHATYSYLNEPAVRYGVFIPTVIGYYEISYHAPNQASAHGMTAYEQLVDSITTFTTD